MSIGANLFLEVWEAVSDLLPNNKREDMARKLVHIFADNGMDRAEFEILRGEDDHLDIAMDAQHTGESLDEFVIDYDDDIDE
jgi:hypothetical protein